MSDLISRQAAIDALAKVLPSLTTPDESGLFDHEIYIAAEAFADCIRIISDLPPAPQCMAVTSNTMVSDTVKIPVMDGATERLPSEQPGIIRCKDCKHRDTRDGMCEGRGWPMQLVPDDGFCDKGERRTDEQT